MTTAELLREARAVIAEPDRWTQHSTARTVHGLPVGAGDPSAVSWCANGALRKRAYRQKQGLSGQQLQRRSHTYMAAVHLLEEVTGSRLLQDWNDASGRQHTEVLDAFSRAIARAERRHDGGAK